MEELKVPETEVVVIVVRKVNEIITAGGVNVEVIRFVERRRKDDKKMSRRT